MGGAMVSYLSSSNRSTFAQRLLDLGLMLTNLKLISIAQSINACISTMYGWAHHTSSIPISNFSSILITIWLSELFFTISTSLAKISILFFYLRLAATRTYRRIIYASIAFITIWGIGFSTVIIFVCPLFLAVLSIFLSFDVDEGET
jgi:hypothetical protein